MSRTAAEAYGRRDDLRADAGVALEPMRDLPRTARRRAAPAGSDAAAAASATGGQLRPIDRRPSDARSQATPAENAPPCFRDDRTGRVGIAHADARLLLASAHGQRRAGAETTDRS